MDTPAGFAEEKHELEAVLASGIFHRAPNLAHLLTYVCAKYFEGSADQIKEYNIAIDALGRPVQFDQKRDSIVRVEAHRLRKRLRDYYDADGASHALRIDIPAGQYAPRFLPRGMPVPSLSPDTLVAQDEPSPNALIPVELSPDPLVSAAARESHWRAPFLLRARQASQGIVFPMAFLLLFCTGAVAVWKRPLWKAANVAAKTAAFPPVRAAGSDEIRILAGHLGADYTDRLGRVWQSDRYYEGGRVFETIDHPIFGTREPRIYQNRREGTFEYAIPLAPGVYEMRLHFAETLYGENNVAGGGESSRVFNVCINGEEALHEFDVISEAGSSTADIRAFKDISPSSDGKLHLRFEPFTNPPLLSAIEITPGTPGRLRPIRMVALDRVYTDKQGRVWEPDRYVRGGQLVTRTKPVEETADPELFRGERYGNLRYVIPVPAGRYGVTMYFAEAWFGPGTPPGGGAGSRLFDVFANGVALRHGFDIFREAKGAGRATTLSAHGLEPDAQGKLNLALVPTRNYACISAIEVTDESK
jgi:hypothetical protein